MPPVRIDRQRGARARDGPAGACKRTFPRPCVGVPFRAVSAVVRGERTVDARRAGLLSGALERAPRFWMTMQADHDPTAARPERRIPCFAPAPDRAPCEPERGSG